MQLFHRPKLQYYEKFKFYVKVLLYYEKSYRFTKEFYFDSKFSNIDRSCSKLVKYLSSITFLRKLLKKNFLCIAMRNKTNNIK